MSSLGPSSLGNIGDGSSANTGAWSYEISDSGARPADKQEAATRRYFCGLDDRELSKEPSARTASTRYTEDSTGSWDGSFGRNQATDHGGRYPHDTLHERAVSSATVDHPYEGGLGARPQEPSTNGAERVHEEGGRPKRVKELVTRKAREGCHTAKEVAKVTREVAKIAGKCVLHLAEAFDD